MHNRRGRHCHEQLADGNLRRNTRLSCFTQTMVQLQGAAHRLRAVCVTLRAAHVYSISRTRAKPVQPGAPPVLLPPRDMAGRRRSSVALREAQRCADPASLSDASPAPASDAAASRSGAAWPLPVIGSHACCSRHSLFHVCKAQLRGTALLHVVPRAAASAVCGARQYTLDATGKRSRICRGHLGCAGACAHCCPQRSVPQALSQG